jgi:hypothetical protein
MFNGARILVAPLDWGLGHSTRDIPIIRGLLELDARPVIGADKGPLALLRDEFPQLPWVKIPGVEVRYAKGASQRMAMVAQFPGMVRSVQQEHALLEKIMHQEAFSAVISDQRFGLRSRAIPSIIITHQVFPFTPFAQPALRRLNRYHIQRFDRCWVADEQETPGLAGELSHGEPFPRNARYIGVLSRLRNEEASGERYKVVAVISGPEPQRTMLEEKLMEQLPHIAGQHLLVRGLPSEKNEEQVGNVRRLPHLGAQALAKVLMSAEHIVTRSGYTTLMDLAVLGRTALLIPTPGQMEQEYLAELHQRTGRFATQRQSDLDIAAYLAQSAPEKARPGAHGQPLLRQALEELAAFVRAGASPTFAGR